MPSPEISIVIPTYRRPRLLERCLASLTSQDLSNQAFEIIVADDGSNDGTESVLLAAAKVLPNLRWTTLATNGGPATARNRGVEQARSDLLLFLDDDVAATRSLVSTHLRLHAEGDNPAMGMLGLVRWAPGLRVTPFMRWLDRSGLQFAYDTWLVEGIVEPAFSAFYTANLSLRRTMFAEVGGFDERFPYASFEDMELGWRMTQVGFRLQYRPEALAHHTRAIDLTTFVRRMAKAGESARLLPAIQPEFPLDEGDHEVGSRGPRRRKLLGITAPFAKLARQERLLDTHYRAEIAEAYRAGMCHDDPLAVKVQPQHGS